MKRGIVFILCILYFAVSSGFVVNIHYCMGKVSNVKVYVLPTKICGCGKKSNKGCCKSELKIVKLPGNYQASYTNFSIQPPVFTAIVPQHSTGILPMLIGITSIAYPHYQPPEKHENQLYLRNCVFRI